MNTFGIKFRLSTFGESHGVAIGGMIDGLPAGVRIDLNFIQSELDKRRAGRSKFTSARSESDKVQILSGVFEGLSTGAPIGFVIFNENQRSKDYENLREIFRPAHADLTYFMKYGIRDHRGGGRASARESAARVVGGAIAQLLLNEFDISVASGLFSVGNVVANKLDWELLERSEIFALGNERAMKEQILKAQSDGDSVGACVLTRILGVSAGLGEGLYNKLDAQLAAALMGINGVKAVEIGSGVEASKLKGSQNNDQMSVLNNSDELNLAKFRAKNSDLSANLAPKNGISALNFKTNHAGGILGGMSSGAEILLKSHFKPTPSIFKEQQTLNLNGENVKFKLAGRHDPCIGVRASVVATAMVRLVIADMLLLNASANLLNLKKIYNKF